nr:proton-conducting transporter membrane subunit [Nitrincola nitratireducens]
MALHLAIRPGRLAYNGTDYDIRRAVAAFVAGGIGFLQTLPKAVLAYSSISQMGLMTCALGAALILPEMWHFLLPTLLVFAFHHAIAKGALFLSVGLKDHYRSVSFFIIVLGVLVPALSLIGVFGSGIQAKLALKGVLEQDSLPSWLLPSITLSAMATTLLMFRFLSLMWKNKSPTPSALPLSMNLGWAGLVIICGLGPSVLIPELDLPSGLSQWSAYPSLLLVPGLTLIAVYFLGAYPRFQIPAGDIIYPLIKLKEVCTTQLDRLTPHKAVGVEEQATKPSFSLPTLITLNQAEKTIQSYLSAFFGLLTLVLIVSLYALR